MRSIANRWMVGVSLPLLAAAQARGEDQVGFSHESYVEDHGRMTVNTEALRVQLTLSPWLDVTARGVYDAISGATPTGAPAIDQLTLRRPITHEPVPNSAITGFTRLIDGVSGASPVAGAAVSHSAIPLAESRDIRRGGDVAFGLTFGPSRLTPQISYSQENDYVSWAGGLNYSLELNDNNTVLSAGWSHAYDRVLPTDFSYLTGRQIKNTDEFVLGVTSASGPANRRFAERHDRSRRGVSERPLPERGVRRKPARSQRPGRAPGRKTTFDPRFPGAVADRPHRR